MFVSGIKDLLYYKQDDKRILLLGENHVAEGCPENLDFVDIADFFTEILLDEKPEEETLDIFLEATYKNNPLVRYGIRSGLARTEYMLAERQKDYKNVRVHYTDARVIVVEDVILQNEAPLKIREIKPEVSGITKEDLGNSIKYLMTIDRKENKKYFAKIVDYLAKTVFLDIRENIAAWEKEYFRIINKELQKLYTETINKETLINTLYE